jgi:alkanesulfonate monooxygenase SsuD/methylene tetrahydromethanopterin reductase-like flavin-dependent oxidoreductase (luciferase family)
MIDFMEAPGREQHKGRPVRASARPPPARGVRGSLQLGGDRPVPGVGRAGADAGVTVLGVRGAAARGSPRLDGVCVTEHSQSAYDVSPNPNLLAAAVAYATQAEGLDVAITVLGRSLGKSREPLKIAEEYALLDCISGGRLIAGFPVGLSYDANLNAAIPAIETRERYREHRELILKAWTEPRPFAWNGRFEKYGQVNIWPRPIRQPHPPIWIPGTGSPGTLRDILQRDYAFVYLSWDGPKIAGRRVFDRYWDVAEQEGRDRNPYRLAFLQVVAVSDTDARGEGVRESPGTALSLWRGRDPSRRARRAGLSRARRHRTHASQSGRGRDAFEDANGDLQGNRRQSRLGRRPDRGVRTRVPYRQPAGDAPERLGRASDATTASPAKPHSAGSHDAGKHC